MTSHEARGLPPLERMDDLPSSEWIASVEARGSPSLKRVDHLERVDRLP